MFIKQRLIMVEIVWFILGFIFGLVLYAYAYSRSSIHQLVDGDEFLSVKVVTIMDSTGKCLTRKALFGKFKLQLCNNGDTLKVSERGY